MAVFKVLAESLETSEQKEFYVDNNTLRISESEFPYGGFPVEGNASFMTKEGPYSSIRIQLGLKCNFSCGYCQQKVLAESADKVSLADVDAFVEKFIKLKFARGARIQFWGGEPLVYWAYIKRMMPVLKEHIPEVSFGIVTNGSLLTKEIVDFCIEHNCGISISHDGPGQHIRGDDPLESNREAIAYAIEKLVPVGKFSFNTMISPKNPSRMAVVEFFQSRFPDQFIPSGEMGMLKSTGPEISEFIRMTPTENFEFRRNLWAELRFQSKVAAHCTAQARGASKAMYNSLSFDSPNYLRWQKCGADRPHQISVDLHGNLLTCHNVSKGTISNNGKSHVIGNLFDDEPAVITEATLWRDRDHCADCPVFSLCHGSCMLLSGEEWDLTCEIEYSDFITLFAIGFEQVTGYIPVEILDESLPLHRRDIWGSRYTHEQAVKKPRVIPIKPISDTI